MDRVEELRRAVRAAHRAPEETVLAALVAAHPISTEVRAAGARRAAALVEELRAGRDSGLMEVFLAEYGLSTDEGVALMCLAEALLRVPDVETIDALIEDKIAPSAWSEHLGRSSSPLVNASTWALLLTGKVLKPEPAEGVAGVLRRVVRRVGEPVIRTAVRQAMRELGAQFVLGRDVDEAMRRAAAQEREGYAYSYDMLGEAALTAADADAFYAAYRSAIDAVGAARRGSDVRANPGVSVKLSALHPRYELAQKRRVMAELVPRVGALAERACALGIGFNIDAEEAARLDPSLDVIEAALRSPALAGWSGFGVVVQAYSKRSGPVIDWLAALADRLDRRIMVRLVKGAYWDAEIKRAQVAGVSDFPVFERKAATDVSYLCCADKLLGLTARLYPQFATHNANSVATILELARARGVAPTAFEFQRLHGMGEALHASVKASEGVLCRIYAPVGPHRDLLAYLVRRLLENGANSSFVNQIVDEATPPRVVARDPFESLAVSTPKVTKPAALFQPERRNSRGWDLDDDADIAAIDAARAPHQAATWRAEPMIAGPAAGAQTRAVRNPARPDDQVGAVQDAAPADVETALGAAAPWAADPAERRAVLERAADLYEADFGAIFALLAREAGKTQSDAVSELREAVDFLRYYAAQAEIHGTRPARGVVACVSPWNFPLAIFTGQIAAALSGGCAVLAKPAEQTPLIAARAVQWLHEAGVPRTALQFLPGPGASVGAALTADPRVAGVCFTGSTETARAIDRTMAEALDPGAMLIAETGGLNAMIVDSTALLEQAVGDVIASAFQSAGQRCSALRILYVQDDVAQRFTDMLFGAMDQLVVGDPWDLESDLGPVIDGAARAEIDAYVADAGREGRLLKRAAAPSGGFFCAPAVIGVRGVAALPREVFGPVLHLARFKAEAVGDVIAAINARGFGLTFGLHTRIDNRVDEVASAVRVGNIYVNRNQIGAIVGSQPFGGEGLSGTGPKAGGPHYPPRFKASPGPRRPAPPGRAVTRAQAQAALDALPEPSPAPRSVSALPGPTGESNRLSLHPRGRVLCLGPTAADAAAQADRARSVGCAALAVAPGVSGGLDGRLDPEALAGLRGVDAVVSWSQIDEQKALRRALARRDGPIIPLITEADVAERCVIERHICVDTTASGGDAALLAEVD